MPLCSFFVITTRCDRIQLKVMFSIYVHRSSLVFPLVDFTGEFLCTRDRACFRTGSQLSVPSHSLIRTNSELCHVPVSIDDFSVIGSASNVNDSHILVLAYFLHKAGWADDRQCWAETTSKFVQCK